MAVKQLYVQARQLRKAFREARRPAWRVRDLADIAHIRLLIGTQLVGGGLGVDVGANDGHFLATMEQVAPNTRHIAFEPIPGLASRLVQEHPNADIRCLALGAVPTESADFAYFPDADGYSGFVGGTHEPEGTVCSVISVPVSTLDAELIGTDPAFIKIDVEGAERSVIEGAVETLSRCKPMLVFEHGACAPRDSGRIHDVLTETGFVVIDIDGGGPYDRSSFVACVAAGHLWNFVALPAP